MKMFQQILKSECLLCIGLYVLFCTFQVPTVLIAQSKHYVLLDKEGLSDASPSLDTSYNLSSFALHTDVLYKTDYRIELYNILFPKKHNANESLVLFSILPDFRDGSLWQEIADTAVLEKAKSPADLRYMFMPPMGYGNAMENMQRKFLNEYILVKKEGGRYYEAGHCLMELFEFRSINPILNSLYGVLNPKQQEVSLPEFVRAFEESFLGYDAMTQFYPNKPWPVYHEGWHLWKEYLSRKLTINGKEAYQFWTFAPDNAADYYNYGTGINRFVYLQGVGIVAGSYDFYFHGHLPRTEEFYPDILPTHRLTEEEWKQNILQEKVMWDKNFDPNKA